ncbi:uncharacterized protein LOC111906147 [Lactuca sativa]|uniref:uncharacterized protein LOC111906147 n=1 Tax=Lactuca sativa TaxID=4236 RepID=UPI0022AEA330|nr:uncharacterized protein LOC111906147 [Lactuca sativa]
MSLHKFYKKKEDSEQQQKYTKIDLNSLPVDPFERPSIEFYHVNQRDEIRRAYLQKGPFQPLNHKFPPRDFGGKPRRFIQSWFDDNKYWLEYSIKEDVAFCLCCYLFKSSIPNQGGSDHFVKSGFKAWNRKSGIDKHKEGTPHTIAIQKCQSLMNQRQSITSAFEKQTTLQEKEYRTRLNASIDCWLSDRCDVVDRVVLKNAPKNAQMKCGEIQKDMFRLDDSRDVSCKEQMALVLRFVNRKGEVVERFIGLRNLALVFVAKNHKTVNDFFDVVSRLLNIIGSSYKQRAKLRKKQADKVMEALAEDMVYLVYFCELESGTGLIQEVGIKLPSDTRWGSHFASLLNIQTIYASICDVLEDLGEFESDSDRRAEAIRILKWLKSFDFVFCLHLMIDILGVTDHLITILQRKDQDIINVMNQVSISKKAIQEIRDIGWEPLLEKVTLFCAKNEVKVVDLEDEYFNGYSRRRGSQVNNLHHYQVDVFNESFKAFDLQKIMKMASLYLEEFPTEYDLRVLEVELGNYIKDVREDERFNDLKSIGDLVKKMVEEKKHIIFPKIYLLMKLALILPVATASVERAFSAMKLIKTDIRNKMSDQFLSDSLVSYMEKKCFKRYW